MEKGRRSIQWINNSTPCKLSVNTHFQDDLRSREKKNEEKGISELNKNARKRELRLLDDVSHGIGLAKSEREKTAWNNLYPPSKSRSEKKKNDGGRAVPKKQVRL